MPKLLARALVAATFVGALAAPAAATAQVDKTCELSFARLEPNTSNTLLLDTNAVYWMVNYQAVPGTRLRVSGEFPHSRYMSFNLYDAGAKPVSALSDVQIAPEAGSSNPFLPGAKRTAGHRRYTVFVEFSAPPAHPAPNTIYASATGTFWYRVYVPDRGKNIEGGVPLPTVSVEPSGSNPAAPLPTADQCASYEAPVPTQVNETYEDQNMSGTQLAVGYPGRTPPAWRLFVNLSMSFTDIMLDNAVAEGFQGPASQLPTNDPNNPGIFSNKDNAYVYTPISRGFGNVLVLHGRAPGFADTYGGARRMPRKPQLRYFSICEYEPISQRVVACRRDDQVTARKGYYTFVISQPSDRPSNATARCGVTWLPWGPQPYGLLIYRHLLARKSFAQAIQHVGAPGKEQPVMGAYYPAGKYFADKAAFERRGCPG
jgi:hypothetical protein